MSRCEKGMTVAEVIGILQAYPQDLPVFIYADGACRRALEITEEESCGDDPLHFPRRVQINE